MHLSFRPNLGILDRIIRLTAGAVLFWLLIFNPLNMAGWVSILLGIAGMAMIIEAVLAY